jgi:hydrogenase-4 component B
VSELLIYLGALHGAVAPGRTTAVPVLLVIGGLALIGGLAAACFTKAFGIVFLGEARTEHAARAHEPALAMRLPILALAASCALIGLCSPWVVGGLTPVIQRATGLPIDTVRAHLTPTTVALQYVVLTTLALLVMIALGAGVRRWVRAGRRVEERPTWDCGYAQPAARMQYTAASFAQPLTDLFGVLLRTQRQGRPPAGLFPRGASLATETPDVCIALLYQPVFRVVGRGLGALRWLQHGRVNLYVLYVALTLLALLVWKLG